MPTFTEIPIAQIKPHPKNIRRLVSADKEMVESIKAHGIITAITVVPGKGDTYQLIGGHRRLDGAKKAKLKVVPAMVRDDLVSEADHIEAMAIENVHRVDLTAIEEAEAYEQLTLIGYEPAKIAETTGRTQGVVKDRLKLLKLDDVGKNAVHKGQITLEQAALLTRLQDHPKALAKVEKLIGSHNFTWQLEQTIRDVERKAKWDKIEAGYKKRALPKIKQPAGGWDYVNGPRPVNSYHGNADAKLADAYYLDSYSGPSLAILKPEPKVLTDEEKAHAAEREKAAQERQARDDARLAARAVRLQHVASVASTLEISKQLQPLLGLGIGHWFGSASDRHLNDITALAGVDIARADDAPYGVDWTVVDRVSSLPAPQLATLLMVNLASRMDEAIRDAVDGWRVTIANLDAVLGYFTWLEQTGYVLPDIDLEARNTIQSHRAELDALRAEEAGAA